MKAIKIYSLMLVVLLLTATSCFDERDEGYEMVGPVATIPVFTLSKTNPVAGETITVSFRYYSENVQVKQLRLTQTIGANAATVVASKDITNFNTENSYEDSFTYTAPAVAAGTVVRLNVEIETINGLANRRGANITVQ
jgi:hypothetical protein